MRGLGPAADMRPFIRAFSPSPGVKHGKALPPMSKTERLIPTAWTRPTRRLCYGSAALVLVCSGLVCCGSPQEPVRLAVPVVMDPSLLQSFTTDLDYEVQLSVAQVMAQDLTFALAGELHASSLLRRSYRWLIPDALAHPGHAQGGDITGELPGRRLLDWLPGAETELGEATLLVGEYKSAGWTFARATQTELLDRDDPLLGHTALLRGQAEHDGQQVSFLAVMDAPDERTLEGIPCELDLQATSGVVLQVRLLPVDPWQGDTLLDGLDFLDLDEDADGEVHILPDAETEELRDAYHLLRRTLMTHDHFEITARPVD